MDAILVTGAAGFIGSFVAHRLLEDGYRVVGLDSFNAYYDVGLKEARWARLTAFPGFSGVRGDVGDRDLLTSLFADHGFGAVIHLAAQAGVRYSIENPQAYGEANLSAFLTLLEACRNARTGHLVYASSSSVYGADAPVPFDEAYPADRPVSLYAATKRANELMAHSYAVLYGLPCTGLRFFTVYGPWGRPDMAPMLFAECILAGRPIDVFNHGDMARDFTYIDDVVEGVVRVLGRVPDVAAGRCDHGDAPHEIFNIGQGAPVALEDFITTLEQALGRPAQRTLLDMQPGDVPRTWARTDKLRAAVGYVPATSLAEGVPRFAGWYRSYVDG